MPDAFPYGRDLYLSVRGTLGAISWAPAYEGEKDVLFVCSDHPALSRRAAPPPGVRAAADEGLLRLSWAATTCEAFVEAIRRERRRRVTGEDGVAALRVVEAVYRAAAQKRWVKVAAGR